MRTRAYQWILAGGAAALLLLSWPRPAAAVPVFARKYGANCTMCHSSYPRLNDYGVRYRQNGYQLPGREEEEQTVLEGPAPFAVRAVAGYRHDTFRHTPDSLEVKHFQLESADLLSGGLLAPNLGYIFVYPPRLTGSASVVAQPGDVEMANAVFSRLGGGNNVRAGRMEPAYVAFSDKRRLSLSPYEVYDFTFPGGVALADTMDGIEAARFGQHATDFYAGWVNGSSANHLNDTPADVYLRASTVLGRGEGQTVGQRLGVTGYFGRSRPAEVFPTSGRKPFHRLGADASLNFSQWNVGLQYLQGRDSGELSGPALGRHLERRLRGDALPARHQPRRLRPLRMGEYAVKPPRGHAALDVRRAVLPGGQRRAPPRGLPPSPGGAPPRRGRTDGALLHGRRGLRLLAASA